MRLAPRPRARWAAPVAVLVAVLVTVALTAILIGWPVRNLLAAFERYLVTVEQHVRVDEVMLTATPPLFTGIAVAIAFVRPLGSPRVSSMSWWPPRRWPWLPLPRAALPLGRRRRRRAAAPATPPGRSSVATSTRRCLRRCC